ncbi:MAG TPA: hypothetical protein VFR18_26110 [Terriglobia bacterium]|nr:hypothetical protein [Terriglobia bacterium]
MVKNEKEHRGRKRLPDKHFKRPIRSPNKVSASTPYEFSGKNLTAYGGLLPIATMLEKLGFQLVEEMITCSRETRVISLYKFLLGIVLGLNIGFPRLNQLRFIAGDPMLTGILKELRLPGQSTLWRFLASLHLNVGTADLVDPANDAAAGLGVGQHPIAGGYPGHRHDGADALRQSDGRRQELQPEEPKERKAISPC